MKKTSLILLTTLLFITFIGYGQVPQALNYQAIARNSMGQMIPSQNIGVRFTITDVSGTTIFYQETHNTTTNAFGLFTLAIGKGTAVSGTIPAIDWSIGGDKYLRVEIAPQGGTNYTMQGTTQLLSVPYALYSEKTKLIAGNAITITNGNTISANYVAGPGITITGNTISATAGNSWLLNGNAGTTATNFLGTTDNQRMNFRTNNITRMYLETSNIASGNDVGTLFLSDEANVQTRPGQLAIFGKEIVGTSAPVLIANSVVGQTWGQSVGNTLGRMIRFSQMNTAVFAQSHFYDLGISQDSSFYLSNHWQQNGGPNTPIKMITISNQDRVGINMAWAEKPTATFHTKGSARFEGITTNNALTRVMVMDANGNVSSRDASTLGSGGGGFWVADANGIHNSNTGHVGIGGNSSSIIGLNVEMMDGRIDGEPVARFASNDTWQTNFQLFNTSNNASFNLVAGGSANNQTTYGIGSGGFGVINVTAGSTIPLRITPNNFVGIGNNIGGTNNVPKARLHVQQGDVYIDQIGSGVIMKSPNGQCWRMTVSNAGAPVFTAISCP